jgi:hypothetical protein
MVDSGQDVRAIIALEEVRRLDKQFRTTELATAEHAEYGQRNSAEWKPKEGSPTAQELGFAAK